MSTDALRRASDAIAAVATADDGVDVIVSSLLAGLDGDDEKARISAAWATCIVADAAPDTLGPLTHGLVERLVESPDDAFLHRTLATIHEDEQEVVREALAAIAGEHARTLYRRVVAADPWDLDDVVDADDGGPDVPTRRLIRTDGSTAEPPETTPGQPRRPSSTDERASASSDSSPGGDSGKTDTSSSDREETTRRRERIRAFADSDLFADIDYHSDFDELTVIAPRSERRYADVVRTRATQGGRTVGVALRLYDFPNRDGDFEHVLIDRLDDWAGVSDVTGVVAVRDWGDAPALWAGTEYVEETLTSIGRRPIEAALWDARVLTGALADLHQRGVVHAGVDPHNVVYPAGVVDGRSRPLFDNVGLLLAYRQYCDPSSYLDPRYAAPEYYSETYGAVDRVTDMYQLGAVLYRLFTGRHPFDGGFDEVREQVLSARPPRPSAVDSRLPDALDDVVAKAMSKDKLTRYDTAVRFHREVAALCDSLL